MQDVNEAATGQALAELGERLTRLEQRLDPTTGTPTSPEGRDENDPFWVLKALKRREPRAVVLYAGVARSATGAAVEWQMGHDSDALLDEDWTGHASALAALGHPTRLRILQLIARGEATTAAELAHADGLGTTGQVYHHLRQLVSAGWLRSTTRGQHQIPSERLVPLLVTLAASR
jgi:DNA-binding transcriptional ArsR family regulator